MIQAIIGLTLGLCWMDLMDWFTRKPSEFDAGVVHLWEPVPRIVVWPMQPTEPPFGPPPPSSPIREGA